MDESQKGARVGLRPSQIQRRRWEDAADARGIRLTVWIYRVLDAASEPYARAAQEPGGERERS